MIITHSAHNRLFNTNMDSNLKSQVIANFKSYMKYHPCPNISMGKSEN